MAPNTQDKLVANHSRSILDLPPEFHTYFKITYWTSQPGSPMGNRSQ